jgi:2-oxoglutarate dehydrogenase E1 component
MGMGTLQKQVAQPVSDSGNIQKELAVMTIIQGFRSRGHLLSTTNPIRPRRDRMPHLDLADVNLTEADLKSTFHAGAEFGIPNAPLEEIIQHLKTIYCGNIGFEYTHIDNREKRLWLQEKIEKRAGIGTRDDFGLSIETKKRILEKLSGAVVFERFLHTKVCRTENAFSLEGGETTIPALDEIIQTAASMGVEEFIFGMAHRGRLNVLANILGKTYEQIFNEFEGNMNPGTKFW